MAASHNGEAPMDSSQKVMSPKTLKSSATDPEETEGTSRNSTLSQKPGLHVFGACQI